MDEGRPAAAHCAPRLPSRLLHRARLVALCGTTPAPVTLVSAPAGFGKSCAIADWLHAYVLPYAWLALDDADDDPVRLVAHFAAALADAAPELAARLERHPPGVPLPVDVLAAFDRPTPLVVVLDDLHVITSEPALSLVRQLIEGAPPALRLVLLTRVDPPLPLARLRLTGALRELREADLRFTGDEAASFFAQALPGGLDPSLVDALNLRTEGWAAGLRLAAIALEGEEDRAAAVHAFAGTHRFVVDYLLEEALGRQRPGLQRFLMESAVLSRFSADACRAIADEPEAHALLEEAERAHLFLVALDGEGRWFRFHHLFRELLVHRLQQLDPERVRELRERGSEWFAARGELHEALRQAGALSDDAALVRLLDEYGSRLLDRGELATVARWIDRVREPMARREPLFLVTLAWFRLLSARAPDLDALLVTLDRALEHPPAGYPDQRLRVARVHRDLLQLQALRYAGRLAETTALGARLLTTLAPDQTQARAIATHNLACARAQLRQPREALHLFEQSYHESLRARLTYTLLSSAAYAGSARVELDGARAGRGSLELSARHAVAHRLDTSPAYGIVLNHLARACLCADALDDAERLLRQAHALGKEGQEPYVLANACVLRARLHMVRGNGTEAAALLDEVALAAREERVGLFETTLQIERARLALCEGDAAGALAALRDVAAPATEQRSEGATVDAASTDDWTVEQEQAAVLQLQALVHMDEQTRARALAAVLVADSRARERGVALTAALAADALLARERPARLSAVDALLQRVIVRGDVRAVLDYGNPMRALLQATVGQLPSPGCRDTARLLIARLAASAPLAPSRGVAARLGMVEPLTDREHEAIELLTRGLGNKAIARAMHISIDTVKTHLKHAYAKLGAAGRRDAVERAMVLGIDRRPSV